MTTPYYADDHVTLYLGDCRDVLQDVNDWADTVITDPPYGETSLSWDQWPDRWPLHMTWHTYSMWVFGSMRMFTDRWSEFKGWKLSQDIVWEKHNGSGFVVDRFKRVHEHALHFYWGDWSDIRHETPVTMDATKRTVARRNVKPTHTGDIGAGPAYRTDDGGPRLMRSVMYARSMNHKALHPTEKPAGILAPLIEYSVPPGGLVLDPFAGSGATAVAAVMSGRRALLIEADERYCEVIAKRLRQGVLDFGGAA